MNESLHDIRKRAVVIPVIVVEDSRHAAPLAEAVDAGAQSGVSPGLHPDLAAAASAANLPYLPGIATVPELMQARLLGLRLCKFFPAQQAGNRDQIRALANAAAAMGQASH